MADSGVDFDIALSFSGDHRAYVAEVAEGLRRRGFRVFYDQYRRAELLGQDLVVYLQNVYSHRSAMVAAFVSEQWASRPYPRHERETVLAHALLNTSRDVPFLVPLRFDDTPVPGLQPTVNYEDLRTLAPGERRWRADPRFKQPRHVTELLVEVLQHHGVTPSAKAADDGVDEFVARLVWVSDGQSYNRLDLLPLEDLDSGETEIFEDEAGAGGPPTGRYLLLREELGAVVQPNEPAPVFLHDTFKAYEKSWTQPLSDPREEPQAVEYVKQQVQNAVEHEITRGSIPIGPTFTRSIETPSGFAVHGICVLVRRAS